MAEGSQIQVEVVFATVESQPLISVTLPPRSSVGEAISKSAIADRFPAEDLDKLQTGIWGQPVERNHILSNGDRVEIYRPLQLDPREARRQLALKGRTMGST